MSPTRLVVTCADASGGPEMTAGAGGPITSLGVLVFESSDGPSLGPGTPATVAVGDSALSIVLDLEQCRQRGFTAKAGQLLTVIGAGAAPAIVFVGCGQFDAFAMEGLRRAAASFVRAAGRTGAAVFVLPGPSAPGAATGSSAETLHRQAAQAVAEGTVLATYRFGSHKSSDDDGFVERVVVAGSGIDASVLAEGAARGVRIAAATWFARDLINEPPTSMNPTQLAEAVVAEIGSDPATTVEVWDEDRIVAERLGGLLGVARGSHEPPRLVKATYVPPGAAQDVAHVVLVGKGITFDSGGLSLKSADGMMTMKTDMSGAAAVMAALSACGDLEVKVKVTAIAPVTENMPGGNAIKPGDVLTIRNGRTIEVLNTDAEGRLVLADGLTLAAEMHPDAIIDAATLTGAQVTALGMTTAAVFGNDDDLVDQVLAASARAGEAMWQLPLVDRYESHIDSDIADMKNIGKAGQAGSIVAALLLARFVDGVPWVHIDMAGPARAEENDGYVSKGGTGFAVRTFLELLDSYGADAS